jgi:preprotein translocase subunit SecG
MLNGLLLTLNIIVCILLIIVVLMQRSEGGALGQGGSPTGLVTARGAGDLLTRITWILFALFLMLSLAQTVIGGRERSSLGLLKSLKGTSLDLNATTAPAPGATRTPGQTPPPNLTIPAAKAAQPLDLSAPKPTVNLPAAPAPAPAKSPAP